jgi:hypothetical protein
MSAKERAAKFNATMKRIDAHLSRMKEREKEMAPLLRELRKIADE